MLIIICSVGIDHSQALFWLVNTTKMQVIYETRSCRRFFIFFFSVFNHLFFIYLFFVFLFIIFLWWERVKYAPVIGIPGPPPRVGNIVDTAGLMYRDLTSDECRGCAGLLISRQNTSTLIQIRY